MTDSTSAVSVRVETDSLAHSAGDLRLNHIQRQIEKATHLLPAQGPITVFVHHNTLHAFEDHPFDTAVELGGKQFQCHPYLPEDRYRAKLARGRIRLEDLESVLIDDLGDQADQMVSWLGTRFHLRLAMLEHPLQTGPSTELRWIVAETDALRKFRQETPSNVRETVIEQTRHWIMRDLRNGNPVEENQQRIRKILDRQFEYFDKSSIESWSNKTWEAFCLHLLWFVCNDGVKNLSPVTASQQKFLRHRDLLLAVTGEDSDRLVNEILIRFCAAFLDQGFAEWPLPNRKNGFFKSFIALYRNSYGPPDRWFRGLRGELKRLEKKNIGPVESIAESLELLGITEDQQEQFLCESLLALRGWAGMIWQMETNADWTENPASAGTLVEYLAVRLILERLAISHIAKHSLGFDGPLSELPEASNSHLATPDIHTPEQRAFLVFQLAQIRGWKPEDLFRLPRDEWSHLVSELESFDGLERRRMYHRAFERRYRNQTLDAVANHAKRRLSVKKQNSPPAFQVICCIDEREESFRRHLEEISPECETLGVAGFFGIAMYYRGVSDAHFTPLCPVIIKPQHYVQEEVVYTFEDRHQRHTKTRRAIGTATHRTHVGTRTFLGGFLTGLMGSIAAFPLVARILFPRTSAQIRRMLGRIVQPPLMTQLRLERSEPVPGPNAGQLGYSVDEMAVIVEKLLRDIGLTSNYAKLIVINGHGSASLNNPHEAAYNCGACGGGRGGPNARAFAQMANDPRVREIVARNGLTLPSDVYFVGSYHNTCDDSMAYYDLERLPTSHKDIFDHARNALEKARERNAHERCRRFESAELSLSTEAALRHVEGRAEDLSQARPECGHATNALCFVGRRDWNRGLFLDRRAFLQSYDPSQDDDECTILTRILQAVVPVCGGINLEYYFSYTDPAGYGCGTKLPHNITSLLGVMDGAASDLRPGLPWQMVEIHEPVRLLFVMETTPESLLKILDRDEDIARIVNNNWVQLATVDPETSTILLMRDGQFEKYHPESSELPQAESSIDWYRGWRDHLGFASIHENI